MAWTFEFEKKADKEFSKLPLLVRQRILRVLKEHETQPPEHYSLRLSGQSRYSRIQVGDYRLVVQIEEDTHYVHIIKVGHRKEIYRP